MKIIAKIYDGKFLVEVTSLELANICGEHYESEAVKKKVHPNRLKFEIGDDVKVNNIFTRITNLSNNERHLTNVRKELKIVLSNIEKIEEKMIVAKVSDRKEDKE